MSPLMNWHKNCHDRPVALPYPRVPMNAQQLMELSHGLGWLANRLRQLPESRSDALSAAAACTMARLVAFELAVGLQKGMDPYDALVDAASGSITLSREHSQVFRLLADRLDEEGETGPAAAG